MKYKYTIFGFSYTNTPYLYLYLHQQLLVRQSCHCIYSLCAWIDCSVTWHIFSDRHSLCSQWYKIVYGDYAPCLWKLFHPHKLCIKRLVHERRNSIALTHQYMTTTGKRVIAGMPIIIPLQCSTIDFYTQTCTYFLLPNPRSLYSNFMDFTCPQMSIFSINETCIWKDIMKFINAHTDIKIILRPRADLEQSVHVHKLHINGLMLERCNWIVNTLELRLYCINPMI